MIAVNVFFLALFAIIGYLAWRTALGTTGPWFSPTISQQVYSSTLISATVLVVGLVAFASAQAAAAARETRALDLRIAILRGSGVTQLPGVIDTSGDLEDPPGPFLEVPTRGVGAALVRSRGKATTRWRRPRRSPSTRRPRWPFANSHGCETSSSGQRHAYGVRSRGRARWGPCSSGSRGRCSPVRKGSSRITSS